MNGRGGGSNQCIMRGASTEYHRSSHPYNAGIESVVDSPTRQTARAPSVKRREVFLELRHLQRAFLYMDDSVEWLDLFSSHTHLQEQQWVCDNCLAGARSCTHCQGGGTRISIMFGWGRGGGTNRLQHERGAIL